MPTSFIRKFHCLFGNVRAAFHKTVVEWELEISTRTAHNTPGLEVYTSNYDQSHLFDQVRASLRTPERYWVPLSPPRYPQDRLDLSGLGTFARCYSTAYLRIQNKATEVIRAILSTAIRNKSSLAHMTSIVRTLCQSLMMHFVRTKHQGMLLASSCHFDNNLLIT